MRSPLGIASLIFGGAIIWLLIAGLLAFQFWPAVPQSQAGWAAFIALGPPLYVLAEVAGEWFWNSRAGRS